MAVTLKDLQPGCIVLIAGFDDIPEHQFQVEEVYDDLVTGTVLTGPLAGEYGEPEIELITAVISQGNNQRQLTLTVREGLKPSPSLFPNEKLPINTKSGAIAPIGDIMSTHIKYAYKRHNTWVYRRTYPQHLQPLLGSSLKQSLKTVDAKTAKARVAELNQTFTDIVKEADQHVSANTGKASANSTDNSVRVPVARPRYHHARFVGERLVKDLAKAYLTYQSERLRPGSYKAIRFATALLVSHLGATKLGDVTQVQGREALSLITQLSPNVRKHAQAKGASLTQLAKLSAELEPGHTLAPQTQTRIWKHMLQVFDWSVEQGELSANPWEHLTIREKPEVYPHKVLTDEQVVTLLQAKDRVLSSALLFGLLTGMRSGEICGLLATDIVSKGNLGRFIRIQPNEHRQLKSKAAEREVPVHTKLEQVLDASLPNQGRLFPTLTVDKVVKAYAKLRITYPTLTGTVFHSTRKWFITQCERTGAPEHYTATLVGHHSARSANKLTYALYSGGISDAQKREIVDGIRLPDWGGHFMSPTTIADPALIPDIESFEERVAIHIHEGGIPTDQAKDFAAQAQGFRNQAHYWAWLRVYVERMRLG